MKIFKLIGRVLSLHRYPVLFLDRFIIPFIFCFFRRHSGLSLGKEITWYGLPIISLVAGSSLKIGNRCVLCSRSTKTALGVNHPVILRTLTKRAVLCIGNGVGLSGTTICVASSICIGDRCKIGANCTIVDTDFHSLDPVVRATSDDHKSAKSKPIRIGDDVFLGTGSYILKGVKIGNGVVVGAASVVTSDLPDKAIAAGNPAKVIGWVGK